MKYNDCEKKLIQLAILKMKDVLLNAIYDLASNPQPNGLCIIPQSLHSIYVDICRAYTELEEVLGSEDRSAYADKLNGLENRVKDAALKLNRYSLVNQYAGELLYKRHMLNSIKEAGEGLPLSNGTIVAVVRHYLSHLNDDLDGRYKMSNLISAVPLRMTRERYADYIRKGLNIMVKDLNKSFAAASIERLRDLFYTCPEKNFEKDFPLMYEKLMCLKEAYMDMDNKDLEENLEDLDNNSESIVNIFDVLRTYYNDINYLRILSSYAISPQFLFDDDMMLKDLFYALKNAIEESDDSFTEEISERAVKEIETRFETTSPFEKEVMDMFADKTREDLDSMPDDIVLAYNVNATISDLYDIELDELLMYSDTDKENEELIEELIEYIGELVKDMPTEKQKFIKQRFIRNVPCSMSKEELTEYIAYALDGINDKNISLMAYEELLELTEHSHEHDDGHDHTHEHGEHCGCGHDHTQHQ